MNLELLAGGGRAVEIKRRGLLEDRPLQLLERRARLEAQLARQELARARVDVERVALALAAIQREHELPDERFAPRVGGHELPQLADELGVAVAQQVRRDARLERGQPLLLQPRDLGRRERLEGEIRERRATREPQRFAQQRRRVLGLAAGQRALPVVEQPREPLGVELAGRDLEEIARRCRAEDVGPAERLAQPRHVHLDALDGARRRVLAPQRERQAIGAHRLVGVQQQHGEDRTGLDTAQRHRSVLAVDLHGPEYPKLHGREAQATAFPDVGVMQAPCKRAASGRAETRFELSQVQPVRPAIHAKEQRRAKVHEVLRHERDATR